MLLEKKKKRRYYVENRIHLIRGITNGVWLFFFSNYITYTSLLYNLRAIYWFIRLRNNKKCMSSIGKHYNWRHTFFFFSQYSVCRNEIKRIFTERVCSRQIRQIVTFFFFSQISTAATASLSRPDAIARTRTGDAVKEKKEKKDDIIVFNTRKAFYSFLPWRTAVVVSERKHDFINGRTRRDTLSIFLFFFLFDYFFVNVLIPFEKRERGDWKKYALRTRYL